MQDEDTAEKDFQCMQCFQTILQENKSKPARTMATIETGEVDSKINAVWTPADQTRVTRGQKAIGQ